MNNNKKQKEGKKLNIKQERALLLLSEDKTIAEIAREINVTRQTIYNWRNGNQLFQIEEEKIKERIRLERKQ